MKVTLEGSNSAEIFSPSNGDIGLRLLSLWEMVMGWCVNFFFVFFWVKILSLEKVQGMFVWLYFFYDEVLLYVVALFTSRSNLLMSV